MSRRHVAIGSTVEAYPRSAWSNVPQGVSMDDLWSIVGPQVDQHVRALPLWKVFCLVYFEGLAHGSAAERRKHIKDVPLGDHP